MGQTGTGTTKIAEGERDAIRIRHMWRLLKEQDRVLRYYFAQRVEERVSVRGGRDENT